MVELRLYSRKDCHLCQVMLEQLKQLLSGHDYTCHVIDIDGNPELTQRYGARIPVLEADGRQVCEITLDKNAVMNILHESESR